MESDAELQAMRGQLAAADTGLVEQTGAACCYALSDKYWVTDPQGVAWETFHTLDTIPMYGEDSHAHLPCRVRAVSRWQFEGQSESSACCIPLAESTASGPTRRVAHERADVPRALPLHGQLRPLHHGRGEVIMSLPRRIVAEGLGTAFLWRS